jgi:nucleoside recognition membrane protein YjiH
MTSRQNWLRFIIPSFFGVIIFLIPFKVNDAWTLGLGFVLDTTYEMLKPALPAITAVILTVSLGGCLWAQLKRRTNHPFFPASILVTLMRAAALILVSLVWLQWGPDWLLDRNTGGLAFELLQKLIPFFLLAGIFLPLLLNYGLMEFVGAFFKPVMQRLAKVPGRAAVDCTASWMGSGSMGVVLTDLQYQQGFYTAREAATIATGFSVVSLPIAIMLITIIGLGASFPQIYAGAVVVGLTVTAISARIPPICNLPDTYHKGLCRAASESSGGSLDRALARAAETKPEPFYKTGARITGDVWFGLLPLVMVLGTGALVLAEHTLVFSWIASPLEWMMRLFGTTADEARAAAPALIIGFADVFLPYIVGQRVEGSTLRTFIAIVGLVQIVFMTEVGALLLRSAIPLRFHHLILIFIIRSAIAMPPAALVAALLTSLGAV